MLKRVKQEIITGNEGLMRRAYLVFWRAMQVYDGDVGVTGQSSGAGKEWL